VSRKHGRKKNHDQPKNNHLSEIQGNLSTGALTVNANTRCREDIGETGKKNEEPSKMTKGLDLMTIFTGFLALFAALSFITLWIQLNDAREAFVKDQRPYVWIANSANGRANVDYILGPPSGTAVIVHYTNFGKSPAVELQWSSEFHVGNSVSRNPMSPKKTILPTNKDDFLIFPFPPLSPEQIDSLKSTKYAIAIKIRWKYFDTSGNWYETDTCQGNLTPLAWGPCETGNYIKDCQKEACQE
jgi:hypothetical protein